jgi:hypothetical protein
MLGAISVGSDGKWLFRQKDPVPIPSRIEVKSSGESVFGDVRNAPADDGTGIIGATKPFRIKKAEWEFDKLELKVEGEGKFKAFVRIFDVSTGAMLGKVAVDADGKWNFRQKNPASVPVRIRAGSRGIWKEKNVANATMSANSFNNLFETHVSAA